MVHIIRYYIVIAGECTKCGAEMYGFQNAHDTNLSVSVSVSPQQKVKLSFEL